MDHFETDTVIVGAGVIGLAIARILALAGQDVVIIERETLIGSHTSSRNSEVIHAGIYYPAGSLKARLCVEGKHQLYEYCSKRHVPHKNCGKLIVATSPDQVSQLEAIKARAEANGVDDLVVLSRDDALALEPHLTCNAALLSPSTGIIDSHALMVSYRGEAEENGSVIAFGTSVDWIEPTDTGFLIDTSGSAQAQIACRRFINAAGLFAPQIAARIAGFAPEFRPQAHYCKGNYYSLQGRAPFERLIYPVPEAAGLGVHLTLDMGGQARFGPDTQWIDGVDYTVDPKRADGFYAAIRSYWPGLKEGALAPSYAGIRPKLSPEGSGADDFRIDGPALHKVPGLINLFGIESPGLTASLAIADEVVELLD